MASLQFSLGACSSLKKINNGGCALYASNKPALQTSNNYSFNKKKQNQMALRACLEPLGNGTRTIKALNKIGAMKKREKEMSWRVGCNHDGSSGLVPEFESSPQPIDDLINEFFEAVNSGDTDKLRQLLAQDCELYDYVFGFKGEKDVLDFLDEVMDALGHSVHFAVESIIEGRNTTAAVIWHLEYVVEGGKGKPLPFTTGNSFFEFSDEDGQLVIRKIKGVEELPVKPGELLLILLKAAVHVFDDLPIGVKGLLLNSPNSRKAGRMLYRDVSIRERDIDEDYSGKP